MNHKEILAAMIVGFCLIFVGSVLGSASSFNITRAYSDEARGNIDMDGFRDAYDISNVLSFVNQLLQIIGGLVLSIFSAIGAFIVEDKYATLGLLLFSALVTVFVLTTIAFSPRIPPTYYP